MTLMRAAVIIIDSGKVALIRRVRGDEVYYLVPGGGVEPGETPQEAAIREVREELGLVVRLDWLVATVEFKGNEQHYYLGTVTGGEFGSGTGEELRFGSDSPSGSYTPVWMNLDELADRDVRPRAVVGVIRSGQLGNHLLPLRIVE